MASQTTKTAAPATTNAPTVPGVVTVLVTSNPKKAGSAAHKRFALYTPGITVGAYKAACKAATGSGTVGAADLRWDAAHGFISISK